MALLHGLGSVTPEQVAAELPRQGVITAEIDGRLMATTEELQEEEDDIVSFAAARPRHGRAGRRGRRAVPARWRTASRSMTASGTAVHGLLNPETGSTWSKARPGRANRRCWPNTTKACGGPGRR